MPEFNTRAYLRSLGEELALAYGNAGHATTPGLVGDAREQAVRTKLESILPSGVAVGTGCVMDVDGNASKQMDIILYEKPFCPVFKIANNVSYYPCESVIAVGSIKSTIGKKELKDIYDNVASVRRLKKFTKPAEGKEMPQGKVEFRTFLEKTTRVADGSWATIQNSSSSAQTYAFGFGQSFAAKPETMIRHAIELYSRVPAELRPNVVLTANQEMLAPAEGIQMSYSALGCSGATFLRPEISLEYLLVSLFSIIQNGVTSPGDVFERYVMPPPMNRTHTFIPPMLHKHDASRE